MLWDYLRMHEADETKAVRYFASSVLKPERLALSMPDVRQFMAADASRRARAMTVGPQHMVNMPLGTPSCWCLECVGFRAKRRPS